MHSFYSDPYLFFRYYVISLAITIAADIALIFYGNWTLPINFLFWYPLLIIPGIALGFLSAVFIHNATHRSFKPLWLNRIIGEICGVHQLYGFMGWCVAHIIHHKYPDDPLRDPHAPGDMTFWVFSKNMQKNLSKCLSRVYYEKHKKTEKTKLIWTIKNYAGALGMVTRLLFWFLLLGPNLFIWFYLPSLIANILFFAHFNYYTHRAGPNNTFEIYDLNHNSYYKLVNFLFFGIYFHKKHHASPYLFNPQKSVNKRKRNKVA